MAAIASAGNRPPDSTDVCSMAETSSRWTGQPAARRSPGVSAIALASVPPEANTTSGGRAEMAVATVVRASSTSRRACRPSAWTDDGLPAMSQAAAIACLASGRSGVVAFQSR